MAERAITADTALFTAGGLSIAGLGVHGPLATVRVSAQSVQVAPRWRALTLMGMPGFETDWDEVVRIDRLLGPFGLRGPFGGTHGVRLVLRRPGAARHRRGWARIFAPLARRPVLGLAESDVEQFLLFAPQTIPQATQRGLFWWP